MEEFNKSIATVKLLKQVMDVIRKNVGQEFKEMNITGPQGMLMGILVHHGEMKISDLSDRMGLSNSTVSGIIDRLEKQGIVERVRSKEDRRMVYVNVTSSYKKNARNHFIQIEKKFEAMMNEATPDEIDKIFAGLELLKNVLERHND